MEKGNNGANTIGIITQRQSETVEARPDGCNSVYIDICICGMLLRKVHRLAHIHTHIHPYIHTDTFTSAFVDVKKKSKPYARSQMSKQVTSIVRQNQDQINRQDSFEMQEEREREREGNWLVLALFFITSVSVSVRLPRLKQNTFPKMDTLKVFTRMHI